ncbi:histidine phosphatase family protein [Streptomyces sp. SCUT-3]|uniref:histidine phosphatase family protein n=1 Tax=Streptomyces sp. SCUT-3 TaxID=2684469 RepID=UPI000CAA5DAD|nr:histidine phosphatase family protein [Streptomyces sp. SCUT-3]PLW65706.1 histidine phosphatase family protein [Streptomyces sp. DJ]QMV25204.1 histidine phosphatase family protein [Streptomyces sp. SCUT-3]
MTGTATRYLYLVRHGEALPDESGLSENGRRQAVLLGRRLSNRPVSVVHHGPLPRAAQTARLIGEHLDGAAVTASEIAGDYVPYFPDRDELPSDCADFLLRFLSWATAEDRERGPVLARQALERFTGPVAGDEERHELVVTHNFLIGWLVRHAMDAPEWRWLGLNQGNAALTVIRYAPGRPSSVLVHNDVRHLPAELSWTGFPPGLHV